MSAPKVNKWDGDTEFSDEVIKAVQIEPDGSHTLTWENGWSFYASPVDFKVLPGMVARIYGKGIGFAVRGLFIAGREVFYRTAEEQAAYAEVLQYGADCAELLERWDKGTSIWTITMGGLSPGYELAIQLAAMEFLRVMTVENLSRDDDDRDATAKRAASVAAAAIDPFLSLSGAQHGAALSLALSFHTLGPIGVMRVASKERHTQCSRIAPSLVDHQAVFHNRLRLLRSIDRHEVEGLSDIAWASFRKDPVDYFIRCRDEDMVTLWAAIMKRETP